MSKAETTGDAPEAEVEQETVEAAERVEEDLDALARQRDEYLDLAQRTKADFENFKKRAARDASESESRGIARLSKELIPALDNLERALEAAGVELDHEPQDPLARGTLLVFRELASALARAGIEAFDPNGEAFDPIHHEAVSTRSQNGVAPGTILEVLQKGYRLGDQLLRPARVVVAEQ